MLHNTNVDPVSIFRLTCLRRLVITGLEIFYRTRILSLGNGCLIFVSKDKWLHAHVYRHYALHYISKRQVRFVTSANHKISLSNRLLLWPYRFLVFLNETFFRAVKFVDSKISTIINWTFFVTHSR